MGIFGKFFKPDIKKMEKKRDVEGLIKALEDRSLINRAWLLRCDAVRALGRIGDARATYPLIKALKDEDSHVRLEAAQALGEIGDVRAVEPLAQALKDEDSVVRVHAAIALGKIGDARAVEPLIQVLKDEYRYVRHDAAEALIKIGDERAVDPLIQYLEGAEESSLMKVQRFFREEMGEGQGKFDLVYHAATRALARLEEIHYDGRDVEEVISKLCTVAIPKTPIITELEVITEYENLRSRSWPRATLNKGTIEELVDAVRPRLERDSKEGRFDGFQLISRYDQKFSQVNSIFSGPTPYVGFFRAYRVWRTEKTLFFSFSWP